MGTNCAPLIADLFLFCYERDFIMSLPSDKQADKCFLHYIQIFGRYFKH